MEEEIQGLVQQKLILNHIKALTSHQLNKLILFQLIAFYVVKTYNSLNMIQHQIKQLCLYFRKQTFKICCSQIIEPKWLLQELIKINIKHNKQFHSQKGANFQLYLMENILSKEELYFQLTKKIFGKLKSFGLIPHNSKILKLFHNYILYTLESNENNRAINYCIFWYSNRNQFAITNTLKGTCISLFKDQILFNFLVMTKYLSLELIEQQYLNQIVFNFLIQFIH